VISALPKALGKRTRSSQSLPVSQLEIKSFLERHANFLRNDFAFVCTRTPHAHEKACFNSIQLVPRHLFFIALGALNEDRMSGFHYTKNVCGTIQEQKFSKPEINQNFFHILLFLLLPNVRILMTVSYHFQHASSLFERHENILKQILTHSFNFPTLPRSYNNIIKANSVMYFAPNLNSLSNAYDLLKPI